MAGDVIFQVFAYGPEQFARVQNAYKDNAAWPSGKQAELFIQCTTDAVRGAYGLVQAYGKLLCLSGDAALARSVAADDWKEPNWAKATSIFAPFEGGSPIGSTHSTASSRRSARSGSS